MISQLGKNLYSSLLFGLLLVTGTFFSLNAAEWQQPPQQFTVFAGDPGADGATDGNGNALAVWNDYPSDPDNRILSSYYTNGAWQPAQTLSNIESYIDHLDVAMDATGTGLAFWREDGTGIIRSSHFSGGVWTTPTPAIIDTVANSFTQGVSVAMNGTGNGVGIWIDATTSTVRSSFYNMGTNSWSPFTIIGTGESNPEVSYSANGTAIATWTNAGVVVASYFNGAIWLAPVALGSNSNSVVNGIDASGIATVAWIDTATGDVIVSTVIGPVVTGPVVVAVGPGNRNPSLAVAPGGSAVLVWLDAAFTGQYSTYMTPTWSAPLPFATNIEPNFGSFLSASVSVDSLGNALIIYANNTNQMFSVQLPLGGSLTPPLLITNEISSADAGIRNLISGLSDNGVGFAFWYPSDEPPSFFGSVLLADPTPPTPPVAITAEKCKNKFASQTDRVTIIRWTPSADATTTSYNLRRNGEIIAVIAAAGPFIYFDHNICKRTTNVYSLTAVNASGESDPLVVVVNW
jgi:hypothetical protein